MFKIIAIEKKIRNTKIRWCWVIAMVIKPSLWENGMFWVLTFLCILVPSIVIWWISKNPREARWYKILSFVMGLLATLGMTAGIYLMVGIAGLLNFEAANIEMAVILTTMILADVFILMISGRLMCPNLKSWQGLLGAFGVQILFGALMILLTYL